MSATLLRRGLELLGPEMAGEKQKGSKKGTVPRSQQKELLASHKTGVKKQLRRMRQQGQQQNQRPTAKGRPVTSAVEEFKKRSSQDHLQQNLKYMLSSHTMANKDLVNKILTQSRGRRAKDQEKQQQQKKVEKSMFTDSDFKRFEKEYFGGR
ncbi:active regulator of SIRT1 [Discoglossus pictus]